MKMVSFFMLMTLLHINYVESANGSDILAINKVVDSYCAAIHSQNETDFKSIFSKTKKCTLISVDRIFEGIDSIYGDFVYGLSKPYETITLIKDEDLQINFAKSIYELLLIYL